MADYCSDLHVPINLPVNQLPCNTSTPLFSLNDYDLPINVSLEYNNQIITCTPYLYVDDVGTFAFNTPQVLQPNVSIGIIFDISDILQDTVFNLVNNSCDNQVLMSITLIKNIP